MFNPNQIDIALVAKELGVKDLAIMQLQAQIEQIMNTPGVKEAISKATPTSTPTPNSESPTFPSSPSYASTNTSD